MIPRDDAHPGWKPGRLPVPGGTEYFNVPSTLARRVMYHPFSLGEVKWPTGTRHQHPSLRGAPFHDDRGFLFHYILDGRLTHRVQQQTFVPARGESVLMDLRHPVEYFNAAAKPVHFLWVWFDGLGVAELLDEMSLTTDPVVRSLARTRVRRLYRAMTRTVERAAPGSELELSSLLAALLAELGRHRPPQSLLSGGPTAVALSPEVHAVATAIARRYAYAWSIKELCSQTGLSLHHFCRKFRRETGYTLIGYLNRYRIEQAKMLLATTTLLVDEIARQVGFPNRKHFAEVFHQMTGVSPRESRARSSGR